MGSERNIRKWLVAVIFSLMLISPVSICAGEAASGRRPAADAADSRVEQPTPRLYVIQVGSFSHLDNAEEEIVTLREKGCAAFYRFEDAGGGKMVYRVYVGRHASRQEARQRAQRLIQRHIVDDCLVRSVPAAEAFLYTPEPDDSDTVSTHPDRGARQPAAAQADADQRVKAAKGTGPKSVPAIPGESSRIVSSGDRDGASTTTTGPTTVRLSLTDAIRYCMEGNREIDVVSFAPKQAQAQVESAESAYDPLLFAGSSFRRDPNLESSVNDIVTEDDGRAQAGIRKPLKTGGTLSTYLETRYGDLNHAAYERTYKHIVAPTVELRQPLLNNIGGKKEQSAIRIANCQATISSAEFRRKVIEVANKVATVYWRLFLYKEFIDINRKNLDMAEEVHRREAERYARGLSQQLDVERARSNAQVRRSTWLKSLEEYKLAMDQLKLLLNWGEARLGSDAELTPVEPPLTLPMDVDEGKAVDNALSNRPEIVKARQELLIREVDQALADHQRLPKLDAYGRYSMSGYGDDFDRAWSDVSVDSDDAWEVGLQFEWAIGNRSAESQYKKKSLGRAQANAQIKRVEDEIRLEVRQARQRLETIQGEIEANRSAREAAENVVAGEFTRFDIGQTSNAELLRAQDLLAVASRSFVRAVVDYNTAINELKSAQGLLPDGITIEEAVR